MRALVLAAGEGTRLRPLTLTCPKPMLPVGGIPVLVYILRWLRWHGITEVAVNLHYLFGRDLVPGLLRRAVPVFGRLLDGYLLDIGTPEAYERAQAEVARLGRTWEPLT